MANLLFFNNLPCQQTKGRLHENKARQAFAKIVSNSYYNFEQMEKDRLKRIGWTRFYLNS